MNRLTTILRSLAFRPFATQRFLVTGAGRDRQGILKDMSGIIWEDNGNVIDSQMSQLAGEFNIMMLVELPEDRVVDVQFRLSKELGGLNVESKLVQEAFGGVRDRCRLEVEGADGVDALHQVTKYLTHMGIGLSDLQTQMTTAPMGGTQLFQMSGVAQIPSETDREEVDRVLQKISSELLVDVHLHDSLE